MVIKLFWIFLEIKDEIIADYNIDNDNPVKINYLRDYSEFLLKEKLYDEKIVNWQIENKDLLMGVGLDMNVLKKVNIWF